MSIPLPRRTAYGLGLSLLAHAAVLAWLVQMAPRVPPDDAPVASMQLTLLRLAPPRTEALPPPQPPQPPQSSRARTASPAAAQAKRAAPASEAAKAAGPPPVIMLAPQDEAVAAESAPAHSAAAVSFDLQAARGAARAYVKGEGAGSGGADGRGRPMRATRDEKLGEAIERAKPADCRNAYAGLGVLAVIPLAASAVTGKGCKW